MKSFKNELDAFMSTAACVLSHRDLGDRDPLRPHIDRVFVNGFKASFVPLIVCVVFGVGCGAVSLLIEDGNIKAKVALIGLSLGGSFILVGFSTNYFRLLAKEKVRSQIEEIHRLPEWRVALDELAIKNNSRRMIFAIAESCGRLPIDDEGTRTKVARVVLAIQRGRDDHLGVVDTIHEDFLDIIRLLPERFAHGVSNSNERN